VAREGTPRIDGEQANACAKGDFDMKPVKLSDSFGFAADRAADPWTRAALDFLERSREVANEVVVDGTRGETSTSEREEISAPRSGPPV
jgi:hypothetical protein